MLKLARILTGIALTLTAFVLLAVYGASLRVTVTEFSAVPARTNPELAQELIETARRDDMLSDLFRKPTRDSLDSYQLITIKLSVRNIGLLPAEWVQLRVVPDLADLALFPDGAPDVPGFGMSRNVTAVLLSEVEAPTDGRQLRLEYYVFGRHLETTIQ